MKAGSRKPQHVEDLVRRDSAFRDQAWQQWRVKDGEKGPMVWEVKHSLIYVKDEHGLPGRP